MHIHSKQAASLIEAACFYLRVYEFILFYAVFFLPMRVYTKNTASTPNAIT